MPKHNAITLKVMVQLARAFHVVDDYGLYTCTFLADLSTWAACLA